MAHEVYDAIVIGAGIIGLSTAWDLIHQQKARTLVLEQFPFPHNRGGSAGQSRIYRNAYTQPLYTGLMKASMPKWRQIEELIGKKLLHECGLLYGGDDINVVEKSLLSNDIPYERISSSEVEKRWPQFVNLPQDEEFLYEPTGGFVAADKAVQGLHHLIESACDFHDNEKVLAIYPSTNEVRIQTNHGQYRAKSLVVAAGPWTISMMARLGVDIDAQPLKVSYSFYKCRTHDSAFLPDRWPITIYHSTVKGMAALFPTHECPGMVKAVTHRGIPADPDARDKVAFPSSFDEPSRRFLREHVPTLEPVPALTETCMYADTPDANYVISRHPQFSRVIMATGFSGHGFKVAPAIGQILSHLAVGKDPNVDMNNFRLGRPRISSKL